MFSLTKDNKGNFQIEIYSEIPKYTKRRLPQIFALLSKYLCCLKLYKSNVNISIMSCKNMPSNPLNSNLKKHTKSIYFIS